MNNCKKNCGHSTKRDVNVLLCRFFPTLGADSSAKSHVYEAVELDDVPHVEYIEVWELYDRLTNS